MTYERRVDSTSGAAGALIGLALILLLLVGSAGIYVVIDGRQKAAALQAEAARQAAAAASKQAELARAEQPPANQPGEIRAAVESVLSAQADAWNRGDVDAFTEHYWKSDDLTFSSGGKTTRGWEETVRGYRERYPTKEKMGQLTFDNLEVTPLGKESTLVLGEWKLDRESEPVGGNFSLVFRKIDGQWVIVHDHTSRLAE